MPTLEYIPHHMRIRQDQPLRVDNKARPVGGKDLGGMVNPLATYLKSISTFCLNSPQAIQYSSQRGSAR